MSIKAMSVVLGFSMGRGNGSRKLVLLGYANHADKHGRTAHPSKNTIAEYCECDTRTAQRHLDWLVGHGYLREGDQHYVEHLDPRRRPIVYDLAMSEDQVERWAAEAPHTSGIRARASKAGRVGGQITARKRWGDKLSPQDTEPASDEDATSGATAFLGATTHTHLGRQETPSGATTVSLKPSRNRPANRPPPHAPRPARERPPCTEEEENQSLRTRSPCYQSPSATTQAWSQSLSGTNRDA